jgi:hypothetical protein
VAETRKLAAILAADVAGYSRLAGTDEDRTLARLRALRSDLIDPTIAVHQPLPAGLMIRLPAAAIESAGRHPHASGRTGRPERGIPSAT